MRNTDPTQTFVRVLFQQMNSENRDRFIYRLTNEMEPDMQLCFYGFCRRMIRSWAGIDDLSREDAPIIEDSRKICDTMGWPVK